MAIRDPRHGKATFHWCDTCGTLLLSPSCGACRRAGRPFDVSLPGDIRPAMRHGKEVVDELFERHFGNAAGIEGRMVFLNKVAGEDRSDEIVADGMVIATMRFDLRRNDFELQLRQEGAALLQKHATKNLVKLEKAEGHLKGKKVDGKAIKEVIGPFLSGDPLIVLVGSLVCSGVARVDSNKVQSSEGAILIRDVGHALSRPPGPASEQREFVAANVDHLATIESKGVSDIKSFIGNKKKPVTISFSGGKDSLAAYGLLKKASKEFHIIFIDTGIEFPETVSYVKKFARENQEKLLIAEAGNAFWEQVDQFGPPAKDFRWCCKVCKLGPVTDLIAERFKDGTVTIEGNRALESFARSSIGFVESNPFVPNQTILNPIKDWNAAEVWGYIWYRGLRYNPLYDEDFERIGCYLCASCLGSEWRETARLHPDMHRKWEGHLEKWATRTGSPPEYVRYGFWRWKVLPPKMRQLAEEIGLTAPKMRTDRMELRTTKGLSLCLTGGYSTEGVITLPHRKDFVRVAEVLKCVGSVRHSPEFEIALVKDKDCTLKVFGGGQIVATGPTSERTSKAFERAVKSYLRGQLCTRCGICVKQCRQKAIRIMDGPVIDEERCNHCGRCEEACVVAHYYDKLVTQGRG